MSTAATEDSQDSPHQCDACFRCTRCLGAKCPECFCDLPQQIGGEEYCEDCVAKVIAESAEEIATYVARVEITRKVAKYDPDQRSAPTRAEYACGDREAYTANSVRASNRHNATNYDDIISDLSRDDALDQAIYCAVREQVEELLEEAEGLLDDDDDDDDATDNEEETE